MRLHTLALLILLAACGSSTGDSGTTGDGDGGATQDGGAGDGGSSGSDGGSPDGGSSDGETPWIEQADCWCYPHTTGEPDFVWSVTAKADDPQGAVSVQGYYDGVTVLQGSAAVGTATLSCDDQGTCSGTFRDSTLGVVCDQASSYTVQVRVLDEDDNWSEATVLTPRQCPDGDPC